MQNTLLIINVVVSVIVVILILGQSRASALGGGMERPQTRRGFEKTVFNLTIIFVVVFLVLALLQLAVR